MVRKQPRLSCARDLRLELRIPPHVIDVDRHAERAGFLRIECIAHIERLPERVDARAVGGLHRVQGLDG